MLRRLLPLLIVGFPALAEASAYETFLKRLDDKVARLASGGWTSRDVRELRDEISRRPESDPGAYPTFVRVLAKVVKSLESGGLISKEIEVAKIAASTKPDAPGRRKDHEVYARAFSEHLVRISRGGIVSKEVELAKIFAGAAPAKEVPPAGYEAAYAAWSSGLDRVEREFARGGLVSKEKKLLDLYRTLQPTRGAEPPPAPSTPPPPVTADPATGEQERFCGRYFSVADRIERRRGGVVIRTRRGDAIAIDDCNQWWLAGDVASMMRMGRKVVLLQKSGTVFVVDEDHGVHRLARRVESIEDAGHRAIRITRRNGKTQEVEMTRQRGKRNALAVRVDGRKKMLPLLYESVRNEIRGR